MKISLHMLAHRLDAFSPQITGEPTGRIIDRIRLREGGCASEAARVPGGEADADVFYSQISPDAVRVEVRAGESVLKLTGTSVVAILNAINDAFVFYHDLERKIAAAVLSDRPEQTALSACEEFMGPTVVFATDFRVLAASQRFIGVPVNAFWDKYVSGDSTIDFTLFDDWESWPFTLEVVSMRSFFDPAAADYKYGLFNSYLDSSGKIIGYVISGSLRERTPFDMDIAAIFMDALAMIQSSKWIREDYGPPWLSDDSLAKRLLLSGDRDAADILRKRYGTDGKRFEVLVTHVPGGQYPGAFRMEIAAIIESCVCLAQGDSIVILTWSAEGGRGWNEEALGRYLRRVGSRMGASNSFEDASQANLYVPQAYYAYEKGDAGTIAHFFGHALSYLAHCDNEGFRLAARHPAVEKLVAASDAGDVDYAATLRAYLMSDRSVNRAAESLYLHRNTVVYRINQARKLAQFDIDDDYERHYLLFSLLV